MGHLKSQVKNRSPGEGCVHLEAGTELRDTPILNGQHENGKPARKTETEQPMKAEKTQTLRPEDHNVLRRNGWSTVLTPVETSSKIRAEN